MRWQPLQFVGGAYTDDATPWTAQDCVNYIPVMAEKAGMRSPAMLRQAPGAGMFCVTGSDAPIRGLHSAEGLLLAVSAQTLYRIGTDGSATSIGTIPGVKRCSIAHNQITAGNQVAIANGSSGYIYTTTTGTLSQITDEGFPGAKVFDFVDQYIVGVEPMGRFWFWSDLAAAGDYNTLDRAEAETAPDKIVTLIATHGEVFVLGERTSEFFYNSGAATGTFQRREAGMEVGCGAQHSVARIDNSVVWLGHDGSVYRLQGYQPMRISTHQIEQAIGRCNWADAYAYTFEDRGHKIYYLTFTDGQTFGFDMATGEWHRRKSYGLDFWRMSHLVRWGRAWIAGDYTNGQLYQLDWRLNNEAGEVMERMRTLPPIHDSGNRLIVNALKLELDTGKTAESFPLPSLLIPTPTITGDVPDGMVGDSGTLQYVVEGGTPPYSSITLLSGSLPPGAAMDANGLVTYTYTTPGHYEWVVGGTDANGLPFSLLDAADVMAVTLYARHNDIGAVDVGICLDGITWTGQPSIESGLTGERLLVGGGRLLTFTNDQGRMSNDGGETWGGITPPASSAGGYKGLYFDAKFWLPLGIDGLASTTDPEAGWTISARDTHGDYAVCGAGNSMVRGGLAVGSGDGVNLRHSGDRGESWDSPISALKQRGSSLSATIECFASDGERIVAGGHDHAMATSIDGGASWSQITSPFVNGTGGVSERQVSCLATGLINGERLWVAGSHAFDDSPVGQIAYSTDGITWTRADDSLGHAVWDCVAALGQAVMVGAGGAIKTSTDGNLWTSRSSSFGALTISSIEALYGDPLE